MHEPGALQRGEAGREHVRGDAGHRGLQLAVAALAVEQRGEHEQRPAVADGADGLIETEHDPMLPSKSLATCKSLIMTALTDLAERLRPSIIGVRRGGSGVVIAPGVAVTLWRNVRAGDATVALAGGEAELLGADRSADLAALRVDPSLPPVPWSDAGPLRIGDPVFALADPAGRGLRATAGAVSSAPRPVRGPGGRLIEGALEHTAPLPRGAGGGPLVDAEGAILGLNAAARR